MTHQKVLRNSSKLVKSIQSIMPPIVPLTIAFPYLFRNNLVDDKTHNPAICYKRGKAFCQYTNSGRTEIEQLRVETATVLQSIIKEPFWRKLFSRYIGSISFAHSTSFQHGASPPIIYSSYKVLNKTVGTNIFITEEFGKTRAFVLIFVCFLPLDDIQFHLGEAYALVLSSMPDSHSESRYNHPSQTTLPFSYRVEMLLIEPDPFYLLLEKAEIAATSASAIGSPSYHPPRKEFPHNKMVLLHSLSLSSLKMSSFTSTSSLSIKGNESR